jgi:hypothetical protein
MQGKPAAVAGPGQSFTEGDGRGLGARRRARFRQDGRDAHAAVLGEMCGREAICRMPSPSATNRTGPQVITTTRDERNTSFRRP